MKKSKVTSILAGLAFLVVLGSLTVSLVVSNGSEAISESKGVVSHTDAKGAAKLVADKSVVVLDIRTPSEFAAGHIAGATNIDYQARDFERRLAALDKTKTYILHCASGRRSKNSLKTLLEMEFKSVVHLDGGIQAWQRAGQPVVK